MLILCAQDSLGSCIDTERIMQGEINKVIFVFGSWTVVSILAWREWTLSPT